MFKHSMHNAYQVHSMVDDCQLYSMIMNDIERMHTSW